MVSEKLYGGVEAGGTKFICAIGSTTGKLIAHTEISTTSPTETLEKVIVFFKEHDQVHAVGIASFGPIDINKQSLTFGYITTTPKQGWSNTDILGTIKKALNVPVSIDTDVNCSALAEQQFGAAKGLVNSVYMTVGTGIGAGCVANGQILSGVTHAEIGHILIPKAPEDGSFEGSCPYHKSCLEGLASGTAISKRWGKPAAELTDDKVWNLEAYYLSVGLYNVISILMPQRIIIGGGVMNHKGLTEDIRQRIPLVANGYIKLPEIMENINEYVVMPELGSFSGVTGAISIASHS